MAKLKKSAPRAEVDLFGEIPVTLREVQIWLFKVPKLPFFSRWRESYVREYNVIDKIKRYKAAGTLSELVGDECCDFCGERLAPDPEPLPGNPEQEIALLKRRIKVLELLIMAPAIKKPVRMLSHRL